MEALARDCAVSREQFEAIWPVIRRHFTVHKNDPSLLTNKQADLVRKEYFRYVELQRRKRKEGWKRKYDEELSEKTGRSDRSVGASKNKGSTVDKPNDNDKNNDNDKKKNRALLRSEHALEVTKKLRGRHPKKRRDTEAEVFKRLAPLYKRVPIGKWDALDRIIDGDHIEACAQEQWQKENGEYARGLRNWVAANVERWGRLEVEPEQPRHLNGHAHTFDIPDYSSGPPPGSPLIIRGDE
jgi:hypothetical protein